MKRKIVKIDQDKCNGCGLCITACHEGALQLIDGKACLVSDSYCDGLGACLPDCPTGAISLEERDAEAFDEELVKQTMEQKQAPKPLFAGCPGKQAREIIRQPAPENAACEAAPSGSPVQSELRQWPCQIKLVPITAPYLEGAELLIAADCTAYAYANIHKEFMHNKITLIGCPKLDAIDYAEKLTEILKTRNIKSVTVLRMEVPCCGGITAAVKEALISSGTLIPWRMVTISTDGRIIADTK